MSAHTPSRPRRARTLMAVLLATSVLAAGGAWTSFDTPALAQDRAAQNGNGRVYGPARFADLAMKVTAAVVNISTPEKRTANKGGAMSETPFPPGSPMAEMFKRFFEQQQEQA